MIALAMSRIERYLLLFPLSLAALLVFTNQWYTEVDDEYTIIVHAVKPVSQTLKLFVRGVGEHEHPPLYDIILHGWLRLTGGNEHLLRLPSIFFYVLGAWAIATLAKRLGGVQSQVWVLILILIWPFGFHFGRLTAWYSFCFFLVSWLTLNYFKFLTQPSAANWAILLTISLALVYSSYFGWALLACVALDYVLRSRQDFDKSLLLILGTGLVLLFAYLPIMGAFWEEVHSGVRSNGSGFAMIANGFYGMYCIFISESVAPWFWFFSVPAGIAIAICLLVTVLRTPAPVQYFPLYFLGLFLLMGFLGIAIPKRLLLITPWLVLSMGVVLGTVPSRPIRQVLMLTLAVTTGIGWYGIFSRQLYAAPHWIEPWESVARQASEVVRNQGTVIGDNPSFFFYLTNMLPTESSVTSHGEKLARFLPESMQTSGVYDSPHWIAANRPVTSTVLLVKGLHYGMPSAEEPELWLDEHCKMTELARMVHDIGSQWKEQFAQGIDQPEWRIEVKTYACK